MEKRDTRVILVAGGGRFSEGFDTKQDIERLPKNYSGGVWTNRIDRVTPFCCEKKTKRRRFLPSRIEDSRTISTTPLFLLKSDFNQNTRSENIKKHYTPSDKELKGPFVRLYEENEELKKQVAVDFRLELKDGGMTVPIKAPKWQKPQDYGSPEVWIKTKVEEDDQFIYIEGKSNLLEGSSLSGSINIPGYISFGFSDRVLTNPDGSFHMAIRHPKTKIDNLSEYELIIRFTPSDGNSYHYILETYGEQGEKLQGKLVKKKTKIQSLPIKRKYLLIEPLSPRLEVGFFCFYKNPWEYITTSVLSLIATGVSEIQC